MMKLHITGAMTALSLLAASPALAAPANATTDLDLRAGPGMDYAVIGVIPAGTTADVEGCLETGTWCRVRLGAESGWANRRHLSGTAGPASPVVASTIRVEPAEGTGPAELDAAVVNGRLVSAPEDIAPLIEIPEDAVAVYMTRRAGPDTPADGEVEIDGQTEAGVSLHNVPGSAVTYLTIDGETRVLRPGSSTTVFINR